MSLIPTTYRDLAHELERPYLRPPHSYSGYAHDLSTNLWNDGHEWLWSHAPWWHTPWWPNNSTNAFRLPMDEWVTQRVRNQLIRMSPYADWAFPMQWHDFYDDKNERVTINEKGFHVDIDVRQFKPHEIVVKATDDGYVIVEGSHDKRNDGNSMVQRRFFRKYLLPRGFTTNEVISNLSSDGTLTIKAPPLPPAKWYSPNERLVQIHETNKRTLPLK